MILDDLHKTILQRRQNPVPGSYVSALFEKGRAEILKKIGEEAVEVIIASNLREKEAIVNELADLWFHCMVLLAEEGLSHDDIFRELAARHEKKTR